MSFSSDTKAELCQARIEKKCCAVAESYGVLLYCNTFSPREIRIITASDDFALRLPKLFKKAFNISFDVLPPEKPSAKHSFLINDPAKPAADLYTELRPVVMYFFSVSNKELRMACFIL